ncbi:MAG: flavin monoamine oxidase family protein [Woeseiaceae bacterium]
MPLTDNEGTPPLISRRRLIGTGSLAAATLGATRCGRVVEEADVIVLGAGLAGLGAALELKKNGLKPLVLEAKNRPGGRIRTLRSLPGRPEAGGTQISSNYQRFVKIADELGIALKEDSPMRRDRPEFWISLEGEPILPEAWASHPSNPFEDAFATVPPWALPFVSMGKDNPLPDVGSWKDPAYAQYDVSVAEHLGWRADQLAIGFGTNPGYGPDAAGQSALMWFQIMKAIATPGGKLLTVAGGNDRVPFAMADALGDAVRYRAVAERVDVTPNGIDVWTNDGRRYRAKQAISTLPAEAIRNLALNGPLSQPQETGIQQLRYNRVVRAYFIPKRSFWDDDGLPPSIWSDGLAGRAFALRGFGDERITMIQSFITGPAADKLDGMSETTALATVQASLESIRPSCVGALEPVAIVSWGNDRYAGGAYACWQPGQISTFANAMAKPAGQLHFAGEHTARYSRGIEGALESAERAVSELLATV